MDFKFSFDIKATIYDFEVSNEDSLEDAKKALKEAIEDLLYPYRDSYEVENVEIINEMHEVTNQLVKARVYNIVVFEDELQDLVPDELIVEDVEYATEFHPELEIEEAALNKLIEIDPRFEDATIRFCDYDILDTESGEPIDKD